MFDFIISRYFFVSLVMVTLSMTFFFVSILMQWTIGFVKDDNNWIKKSIALKIIQGSPLPHDYMSDAFMHFCILPWLLGLVWPLSILAIPYYFILRLFRLVFRMKKHVHTHKKEETEKTNVKW